MSKAIISRWECLSCGNIMNASEVLIKMKTNSTHSFSGPTNGCTCGNKSQLRLLSFEPATAVITPDKKEE